MAILYYSQAQRVGPLQNQNNFWSRLAFLNKHTILPGSLNKSFRWNSWIISDCKSDHKFSKSREHGDFTVCSSSRNSSTRKPKRFLESLGIYKLNIHRILSRGLRKTFCRNSVKMSERRAFIYSQFKTVLGFRVYSHCSCPSQKSLELHSSFWYKAYFSCQAEYLYFLPILEIQKVCFNHTPIYSSTG